MKNKLVIIISFCIVCVCTFVSTQTKSDLESDWALDNIEALAQNEGSDVHCTDSGSGCYDHGWYPVLREIW